MPHPTIDLSQGMVVTSGCAWFILRLTGKVAQRRVQCQHVRVCIFGDLGLGYVAVGPRKAIQAVAPPGGEIAHASSTTELILYQDETRSIGVAKGAF